MHHSDRKVGDTVKVHFSADYDAHHEYHASDLTNKKISLVAETTVVKKPEKPVPPRRLQLLNKSPMIPLMRKISPDTPGTRWGPPLKVPTPSVAVVRAIVAENTDLDRDLLTATTATPFYRNYVKAGTIRPSYFSYRHPTKGILARAFAEREGLPAEGESRSQALAQGVIFLQGLHLLTPSRQGHPPLCLSDATVCRPASCSHRGRAGGVRALAEVPLAHP